MPLPLRLIAPGTLVSEDLARVCKTTLARLGRMLARVRLIPRAGGIWTLRALRRRRVALRWEFWPSWAAYLPMAPYFAYLAIRHRSATLFTLANPSMEGGGLVGESKSAILSRLAASGAVAEFSLVGDAAEVGLRMRERGWSFPVVLKPDVGERGSGVAIVRSEAEVARYFEAALGKTILQEYVPGVEAGVFYVRRPGERMGRIVSITEKRFPAVTGDGRATLWQLILSDTRAACLANTYRRLCARPMDSVPAEGERVQLVEIGSHCRGAIFLNGAYLATRALEAEIDRIAKADPEFFLGRFDIRAASVEEFQAGRLRVIELNGVASEPTHIYDPSVSLFQAYVALFGQWRTAFEIGAANRGRGLTPISTRELVGMIRRAARP